MMSASPRPIDVIRTPVTPLNLIPESVAGRPVSPLVTAYLASAVSCARKAAAVREQAETRYGLEGLAGGPGSSEPCLAPYRVYAHTWIAGGFKSHWPNPIKDAIRSAEHARTRFLDAAAKQWRAERRRSETFRRLIEQMRADGGY